MKLLMRLIDLIIIAAIVAVFSAAIETKFGISIPVFIKTIIALFLLNFVKRTPK